MRILYILLILVVYMILRSSYHVGRLHEYDHQSLVQLQLHNDLQLYTVYLVRYLFQKGQLHYHYVENH